MHWQSMVTKSSLGKVQEYLLPLYRCIVNVCGGYFFRLNITTRTFPQSSFPWLLSDSASRFCLNWNYILGFASDSRAHLCLPLRPLHTRVSHFPEPGIKGMEIFPLHPPCQGQWPPVYLNSRKPFEFWYFLWLMVFNEIQLCLVMFSRWHETFHSRGKKILLCVSAMQNFEILKDAFLFNCHLVDHKSMAVKQWKCY